ncbi:phosphatidylinositol 3- and 4-kinase domain-containing protein [Trichoderma breve]|uniref:Phosphatidylinositol 3-kinase VPS34 n=1 Tax=Trichoderma breve TaxID=2034170 RepID=A0A9W9BCR9_9HYPO|nr:phosphatidylinositol 3- and 4-kinase domain-containing protein [Trichoderma breve]KAJ4857461.1 phosphatidylinositol 3- and 4-kinase domain-containing protein [Trichoderma breve]
MAEYGRIDPFSFAASRDIESPVSIRIIGIDGDERPTKQSTLLERPQVRHIGSNTSSSSELYVTVQVWAGSKALTVPIQTSYKPPRPEIRWNEWLRLPISYKSIPANSRLAITIWDLSPDSSKADLCHATPFGGTTLALFGDDNQVVRGRQKCYIHKYKNADGTDDTTTPAVVRKELERMESLFKKHEMGEIPRVDWLDQMVFRGFEKKGLHAAKLSTKLRHRDPMANGRGNNVAHDTMDHSREDTPDPYVCVLNVELPRFDFPVVFADHEYEPPPISALQPLSASQIVAQRQPEVQFGPGIKAIGESSADFGSRLVMIYDPEVGQRDNPAEAKHRRLFRSSHRHGILDRDLKPNAKVRDELNVIMSYPPTHILSPEEADLVWKFRYHLTKDKRGLAKFVRSVNWNDQGELKQAVQVLSRWTEIDVDDALGMLGPSFDNPTLVQALKYEYMSSDSGVDNIQDSPLAQFLIQRAAANFMLGNYFHWYLMVECDDYSPEQDVRNREIYRKVAYEFMTELVKQPDGNESRKTLLRQAELLAILSRIANDIKLSSESIAKKTDRVKAFLGDPKNELMSIDPPLAMPLDPSIKIIGVIPDQVTVFKSSLNPIKCTFKTTTGSQYPIIFKLGDDLRQDQLVIQIITLMDELLQKENLDLKLSPYKILATSTTAGASQFVQSQSLSSIVNKFKNNPALAYLKHHNPDDRQPLGVRQDTLDTYVKSCAGYCVITYILGVGDRHLDNLLLAPDGHFFHADFGYILGRDPKPFAPLMKLSKEMVDCMGGVQSEHYRQFKQYCFLAYTALRKSSNLILNLFSLMVHANIPDIRLEPDKAVSKVRERFHLEMGEEEAIRYFERVIEDTLTAFAPVVIDKLHEWAQALRA